jgi:hypothetical protein
VCCLPRPVAPSRARARARAQGGDRRPSGTGRRRMRLAGVAPAGSSATAPARGRAGLREPGAFSGMRRRQSPELASTRRRRERPCAELCTSAPTFRLELEAGRAGVSKSRKQSTRDQKILRYFLYKIDLTGHDSLYLLHEGNSSVRILCCFVEIENSHGFRIPKIKLPQILLLSAPYLGRRGPRTNRCPIQ